MSCIKCYPSCNSHAIDAEDSTSAAQSSSGGGGGGGGGMVLTQRTQRQQQGSWARTHQAARCHACVGERDRGAHDALALPQRISQDGLHTFPHANTINNLSW